MWVDALKKVRQHNRQHRISHIRIRGKITGRVLTYIDRCMYMCVCVCVFVFCPSLFSSLPTVLFLFCVCYCRVRCRPTTRTEGRRKKEKRKERETHTHSRIVSSTHHDTLYCVYPTFHAMIVGEWECVPLVSPSHHSQSPAPSIPCTDGHRKKKFTKETIRIDKGTCDTNIVYNCTVVSEIRCAHVC